MGRNKKSNKQKRLKKQNEKLMTALTSTAASTQVSAAATTPTTTTASDAIDNDNGTTETTTTLACYHGSDEGNFAKTSDYQIMVFDEWTSVVDKQETAEYPILLDNFATKHTNLLEDPNFYKHSFARTTNMFLESYGTEKYSPSLIWKLQGILRLAIDSKYWYCTLSVDREKHGKFVRDIQTDRGIINVLHRETSPFCHCMQSLKSEAKRMEKIGMCYGCGKDFPKQTLKRCNRCDLVQYCSNECLKNNWSLHKKFCNTTMFSTTINKNNKTSIKSEK